MSTVGKNSRAPIAIVYPETGYPVEMYKGLSSYSYMGRRVKLIKRILDDQFGIQADAVFLKNNDVSCLREYKCVVPLMVNVPESLSKIKAQNALYIPDPEKYDSLDVKSKMVDFSFTDDVDADIPQIRTLTLENASEEDLLKFVALNTAKSFIFKQEDSAGSLDQTVLGRNQQVSMREFLGKKIVMQPFHEKHDVFAINALFVNGKVIAHFCGVTIGGLMIGKESTDLIFDETVKNLEWKKSTHKNDEIHQRVWKKASSWRIY